MEEADHGSATTVKTLWTETILDVLYLALKYEKPDKDVLEVLRYVKLKGCKPAYVIDKVRRKLGDRAAFRVKSLM